MSYSDTTYVLVPVRLSDGALGQVLLGSSDVVALWEILLDLGAEPSSGVVSALGVREPPLQVGHETAIRRLLTQVIGVLLVNVLIGAACKRI